MRHEIRLFEVVATYRLSPLPMPGQVALRFKIEILRSCGSDGRYSARVCRLEALTVHPSFGDAEADEVVEVEDLGDWGNRQFDTRPEALDHVLTRLRNTYTHCDFPK